MNSPLWSQYDGFGDQYRQHAEDGAYNAHYEPAVLAELGEVAGKQVLDAACGPGLYALELIERGAEVTAFDASQSMVELARDRVGAGARIDQAVLGEPLPYEESSFDTVVCALAIHYAPDLSTVFGEFYRVLRPGGRLVVSTQHPTTDWLRKGGSYFETTLETDSWVLATRPTPIQYWRVSLTEVCSAATDTGFVITRLVEPRPAEAMRARWPDTYAKLNREPGFLILQLQKCDRGQDLRCCASD